MTTAKCHCVESRRKHTRKITAVEFRGNLSPNGGSSMNAADWPAATEVDALYSGSEPQWFELASDPNSDSIALVFSDSSKKIFAAVWNGTSWSSITSIATGSYQAGVSVAYQAVSGCSHDCIRY